MMVLTFSKLSALWQAEIEKNPMLMGQEDLCLEVGDKELMLSSSEATAVSRNG